MRLVRGDVAAQGVLEQILETAKPPLPPAAAGLHWLLATPFRCPPPPYGSRFRAADDPGVFYAGEDRRTACAEAGYWRLRFWLDSDGLRERCADLPLMLFQCHARTEQALDLTVPPLARDQARWSDPVDYAATQALATVAREVGIDAIRYASARYPPGTCLAFLTPRVFHGLRAYRGRQQGWTLMLLPPSRVVWQRNLGDERWAFEFSMPD